jgi:hypothetical protein
MTPQLPSHRPARLATPLPGTRVRRQSQAVYTNAIWGASSNPGIDDDVALADQLGHLLGLLEPHTAALWQLVECGYKAN